MRPIRATQATPILLTKSSNRPLNLLYEKPGGGMKSRAAAWASVGLR
jgi:hypothetical protein